MAKTQPRSSTRYCSASATWSAPGIDAPGEVRNRSGHLQHPVISPGAQAEPPHSGVEQAASCWFGPAETPDRAAVQFGVDVHAGLLPALLLPPPRRENANANRLGRFRPVLAGQVLRRDRRHLQHEVDAIAKRARQPAAVALDFTGRAAARADGVAQVAAGAGVHRRHQHEAGGENSRARRARDRDPAFLQRLPQHLEDPAIELRHFVEEQHAVVRERNLAGAREAAAADQRDVRNRVMRRPERPVGQQADARAGRGRRRSGWRCIPATRRRSAEGGSQAVASPSSSCPRQAGRSSGCCGRRPPQPPAPSAPAPGRGLQRSRPGTGLARAAMRPGVRATSPRLR